MSQQYRYSFAWKAELHRFYGKNIDVMMGEVRNKMAEVGAGIPDHAQLLKDVLRQSKIHVAKPALSLADVAKGANALIHNIIGPGVDSAELLRRSNICSKCPNKTMISGCQSCGLSGRLSKYINSIKVNRGVRAPIPSEVKDAYCEVCSCALASMVITRMEDFKNEKKENNIRRPDFCWLKTTSPNYHE